MLLVAVGQVAHAQWQVQDLHPSGASESVIYGLDDSRQVGFARVNGIQSASLWSGTPQSWINLNPIGSSQSYALSVWGTKQTGGAWFSEQPRAIVWNEAASSFTDLTPTGAFRSDANRSFGNQQAGSATFQLIRHAGIWSGTASSWVDLHPPGATESFAYSTNGTQQVGGVLMGATYGASLWSGSANSWVSLHPAAATQSYALGISDTQQVGHASVLGAQRASLWSGTAGSWINLHPPGCQSSVALSVRGGQQVGYGVLYGNPGNARAGMWTGTAASWVDLHAYLPSNFSWSEAVDIWNDGTNTKIGGFGFNTTTQRKEAILWTAIAHPFDFVLNKSTVAGQNSVLGTVSLSAPLPANTVFRLRDNSTLVSTPETAVIAAGATSKSFQISVTAITSTVLTSISAQLGPVTRSQPLTLTPLIPTALSFTPSRVIGGSDTSCRLVLNGVAGPGGRTVSIFDNSAFSTVPASVVVPAGASSVTFPITTSSVTTSAVVTVTARVTAGEKTATFRIDP